MSEPVPERREALRKLTAEAVEAGSYGEPAPEMRPTPPDDTEGLREQIVEALYRHAVTVARPTPFPPAELEGTWLATVRENAEARADAAWAEVSPVLERLRGDNAHLAEMFAGIMAQRDEHLTELERLRAELAATEEAAQDAGAEYRECKRKLDNLTRWAYDVDNKRMAAERDRDEARRELERYRGVLSRMDAEDVTWAVAQTPEDVEETTGGQ